MNQCGPTFEAERKAALRFSAWKPTIFWNVDIPHRKCATNIFFWGYSSWTLGIFSKRWLVTWAFCQVNCLDLSSHLTLATWLQVSPKLGTQISKSTKYQFCSLLFKKMIHAHTFQDWHLLLKNTGLFFRKKVNAFSQVSLSQRKKIRTWSSVRGSVRNATSTWPPWAQHCDLMRWGWFNQSRSDGLTNRTCYFVVNSLGLKTFIFDYFLGMNI